MDNELKEFIALKEIKNFYDENYCTRMDNAIYIAFEKARILLTKKFNIKPHQHYWERAAAWNAYFEMIGFRIHQYTSQMEALEHICTIIKKIDQKEKLKINYSYKRYYGHRYISYEQKYKNLCEAMSLVYISQCYFLLKILKKEIINAKKRQLIGKK
jgi:hypothetical protein